MFPIGTLYPSQQGGPSNTIYWIAKALVHQGVHVTIVTTNVGTTNKVPSNQWINTDYGRVIYYSTWFPVFPLRMVRSTIAAIPHCDLVHLTSLFYPPSLVAALAALWYGKPIVWSSRGELDRMALVYSSWKKKPILWLIRQFLSKKIVFHSTSPEETLRVKLVLGQQVQTVEIPNFLELPTLVNRTPVITPYLLCIGRIHPIKAIENLIASLQHSPQFLKLGINLIIAGDCNNHYAEQLKTQVHELGLSSKIQFIGHVEGASKQKLYANAYFTLLISHAENFGNVVVESLAQGTPVIASVFTPWEILPQQNAGFWVNNTPEALSACIDQVLKIPKNEYLSMRRSSVLLVEKEFDIKKNIIKWKDCYSTILHSEG